MNRKDSPQVRLDRLHKALSDPDLTEHERLMWRFEAFTLESGRDALVETWERTHRSQSEDAEVHRQLAKAHRRAADRPWLGFIGDAPASGP